MRIAVIGAGNFGKNHVRTLHQIGVLAAVADMGEATRTRVTTEYPDVPVFASHEELLQKAAVDAVTIATPAHTHHTVARQCLEAGKDVFVEKPMTLNVADAEDLQKLASEKGRILMAGHLLIYQPAIAFIHDYLKSGQLRKIFTLHQERAKLGKARAVENALWSLGVHDVAVLLHLVGESPQHVSGFGHRGLQTGIEDDTYVHLAFPSGIKATLHNSWLWPEDSRVLRIIGSDGMLIYNERAQEVSLARKTVDSQLNHTDAGSEVIFKGSAEPLRIELEHFIECCRNRSMPASDGRSAIEVIRVMEQAMQSFAQS